MAVSGSIIDPGQVSNVTEKFYCLQSNRRHFCELSKNAIAEVKRQLILVNIFLHHLELLILYFKNVTDFSFGREKCTKNAIIQFVPSYVISICQRGHTKSQPDSTGKKEEE